MILEKLVVGPYASNCYIVGSEPGMEGMIIDPGSDAKKIVARVKDLKLKIKVIVITHGHADHFYSLRKVKEITGGEVAIHEDDAAAIQQPAESILVGVTQPPVDPDRLLKDGDSIDFGDVHFVVMHTPGHSRGGICLLGHGILFSGDTLFNFGIGRYDMPGASGEQLGASLRKLMKLPGNTIVYPGHGPDTTIAAEREGNPFLRG